MVMAFHQLDIKDFWEYDPAANTWTQKADFGGGTRSQAVGFSIGNKGYIGTGKEDWAYKRDFWEYDPATDTWTQKADFGGTARCDAVGFSIGNKGYLGTGFDNRQAVETSGSTTLPPIPGRKRQILEGRARWMPSVFPSGARATSARDWFRQSKRLLGVRPC